MKHFLALCALLAVGSCAWEEGLRVRFGPTLGFGDSYFIDIPRTRSAAVSRGLTQRTVPPGLPLTSVDLYCFDDLIVCTFYGFSGNVVGLQIALPESDVSNNRYDMEETGFTRWNVTIAGVERSYWAIQQYFTTEENLQSGAGSYNRITENGVWVTGVRKELLHIKNSTDGIVADNILKRQGCIPGMSRHYYYQMDDQLSCDAEPVYPWFAMVHSGDLVATGFMVFLDLNLPSGARNWFENPPLTAVKIIVPDAPQCLYDLAEQHVLTMHVYYINSPWLQTCLFQ